MRLKPVNLYQLTWIDDSELILRWGAHLAASLVPARHCLTTHGQDDQGVDCTRSQRLKIGEIRSNQIEYAQHGEWQRSKNQGASDGDM